MYSRVVNRKTCRAPTPEVRTHVAESESAQFFAALRERVAPEQIPKWLGGVSDEPWPYSEGGDVPHGELQRLTAALAVKAREPA